jgi:hypothetical protein
MSSRYSGGVIRKNQLVPTTSSASGVWDLNEATQSTKSDIWPYSGIANPISQSLRIRRANSAYLQRTPATQTNRSTWTYSFWHKRGLLSASQGLINAGTAANIDSFTFNSSDKISIDINNTTRLVSTQVFRDPSAWYHFVWYYDATQGTASNRMKVYVNGVEITAFDTDTRSSITSATSITNTTVAHRIGYYDAGILYSDGYMADVNFIDGQALDPSYFGQTSAVTGVWEPKQYTGTYGTNGWHLEFKDTTVGQDTSGNNNDWTPNNISTTLNYTNDLVKDVPTQWAPRDGSANVRGNYCTLNPVFPSSASAGTLSNGNLKVTSGNYVLQRANWTFGSGAINTGKWYWEVTFTGGSYGSYIGITSNLTEAAGEIAATGSKSYYGTHSGRYYDGTVQSPSNYYDGVSATQGYALDLTGATPVFYVYKADGTLLRTDTTIPATISFSPFVFTTNGTWPDTYFNFGQQPFVITPPSGFKSLCTTNLPTPTIGATVATAANKYFDATLYTGTGATLSVTNAGAFQPDFVWLKSRSAATNHQLFDVVRGTTKVLTTSVLTEAEQTAANTLTSFNSSGFTIGTNTAINTSSSTYVGWQWKAGSSTVTNTTGTISAQVCANPTTGFSIITYAGNSTDFQTVGHGLGITPQMVIVKGRTSTNYWPVWHTSLPSFTYNLYLNTTDNQQSDGQFTSTSSTTVGVRNGGSTNQVGTDFLMYCWAPIAGYSAFGSYTGNGSANGPFVYTGFKPRFIMIKRFDGGVTSWYIVDTAINTYNEALKTNYPNLANAEGTNANFCDFLSNGFKIRESGIAASGASYLYAAWAENPFKTALAR